MRLRARHILHPLLAVRSLAVHASRALHERQLASQYVELDRELRSCCWCGGPLLPFSHHQSYGVCDLCGTYVNKRPPTAKELNRIYSFSDYWHKRQRLKGHPVIESRAANDAADGRLNYWLELVGRYAPPSGCAIEVGCAHGILLSRLAALGYQCIGVEPDSATAAWTQETTGIEVRSGLFPDVELPACDLFMALDVLEHSPDPEAFMRGVARLLKPGGIAIVQTPIDRYAYTPPFGERFADAFDDVEHLFLFTDRAMNELARRAGLEIVAQTERLWLHHEICVFTRP